MAIELRGLDGVLERLEGLVDLEKIDGALTKAAALVERAARQKAPSEKIAQTITSRVENLVGIISTPLEYAPYVEYGTGKFSEHPNGGRKETPWVYVEGSTKHSKKKTIYTEQSAKKMVAIMRESGLDAHYTHGQHAQPYMRPALDENRDEIKRILGEGLKQK